MKRYAVLDEYGAVRYELSGAILSDSNGSLVAVTDDEYITKAVIHLAPGCSIMEVCDVVAGERHIIEGGHENSSTE